MDNKLHEVMNILSEECAEVIQTITKCQRFGLENYSPNSDASNRQRLCQELGDVLAMIEILVEQGHMSPEDLIKAKEQKTEKLLTWSNLFK